MTDETERELWREALGQRESPPSPVPAETVWRAVAGELNDEALHALLERLPTDPDLQLAWRLAMELDAEAEPTTTSWSWGPVLVLAAMLCVAVGIGFMQPAPEVVRGPSTLTTPLSNRAPLRADAPVLTWDSPQDSTAVVELRDADLNLLRRSPPVSDGTWTVPAEALLGVADGEELVWQVLVETDGITTRSPAFIVVYQR